MKLTPFNSLVLAKCLLAAHLLSFPPPPLEAAGLPAPPPGLTLTNGVLTRKVLLGITGNLLENLTNHARFPNQPDLMEYVSSFETPTDLTNYYGVQLKGYVEPPVSGEYVFYLCSDDQGALFLSTDADPANKRLIASEPQWNGARQWINGANQASRGTPPVNISAPIHLEGGGKYYIEALMKEGEGGDNLSVAWQMPGDPAPTDGGSPIPGQYLSSVLTTGSVVFTIHPRSQTVTELQPATFRFEMDGTPPFTFQWFKNGSAIAGVTNPVYTLPAAILSDSGAVFTAAASNAIGGVTSSNAVLTVTPDLAPPTLVRVRSLTLERVEVSFSKPVSQTTATNLAHYAITNASGTLTLSNAVLDASLTRVILTTSRQLENTNYTLTVNGVRDTSAAGNLIAANSQMAFTPYFPDEFVGPFPSWGDVKRDYGAIGDGVADDTAALQRALDNLGTDFRTFTGDNKPVLYLPAGTYRITQGLNLVARPAVSVVGEDPANTIIKWDGPADGVMILLNGFSLARMGRLTFDGAGRALSAVDQKWDGSGGGGCAPTGNEYADLVLKDVQFGIRGGNWNYQNNDAEVAVLRCRFLRCSKAGLSMESFNAMDWWVWHSLFEDCALGVCNTYGSGAAHVQESVFRRSTESDIAIGHSGYFFMYQNYSIGSRTFFRTGFNGVNEMVTLQGNTIIDPIEMPISGHILGPLLLIDNVIRSRPGATGPVAEAGHDAIFPGDLVSIGNTYTVTNALRIAGRLYAQDDVVLNRDAVNPPEPELPGALPNLHRPVFEVPIGADAVTIQQVIDTATQFNGQRPVVHLSGRNYRINRSLVIPAGSDLQLVGDSYYYGTTLEWTGTNASTLLQLASPNRATLREFRIWIDGASAQAAGISIDGCDQPGARIFGEQVKTDGLLADRLDHARVDLRDFVAHYSEKQQIAVRVIGGPLQGSGQPTEGRVNIFSGAAGYGGSVYDVLNGGHLLVRDMYYEGRPQRFLRLTGSGTFTLQSGRCHVEPVANPVIEFKDFHGQASLVSLELYNTDMRITGGGQDTRVLGLGLASSLTNAFVNDSPDAQVALLGSRTGYNGVPQVSVTNYTNQVGSVPDFVRQMLAQTRGQRPQPLTRLPDGVTDVRMYRVSAGGGSMAVGIQLNRDHQATIITQPQSQTAGELRSATFSVTPAGPVPYSLQWFRNGAAIPDATNLAYTIPSVALSDVGAVFSVTISNEWNSVTSSNAFLTVIADNTPPQAVLAASYDPGWITVSFDELLDPISAGDSNHFTVSGGAFVNGAYLRSDGKSVLLRVAGPLETNFTLAVSNLLDRVPLAHNATRLVVTGSVMGLTGADIGNAGDPPASGSTRTLPDGTIEVIAGGTDIWNRADDFHYSYQPRVGDFDVRVQVSRLDAINAWSKAGLMMRESLAPNSRQLSVLVTPVGVTADGGQGANTYQANWRIAPDAPTTEWAGSGHSAGVPFPNAWIRLRREGNLFTAYRGTDGLNWTLFARMNLDALEAPMPETVFLGLATTRATTVHYQNFGRADLPPVFNCLAGYDIGGADDPLEAGSTVFQVDDSIEVVAGGTDIWNRTDGFHFTAQKITGDFDAQVRVSRLGAINTWSKAGLMVRESLDAGSRNLAACVTPLGPTTNQNTGANVYQFLLRPSQDGDTANLGESAGVPYPDAWIRLRREGNTFTAYRGTNGTQWTQYAQTTLTVPLANTVYLGLATTAHDNTPGRATVALYRNYAVFPAPPVDLRPKTTHVGGTLAFSMAATAPYSPWKMLTYSLEPGAPAGSALDSVSGLFTWTPSEAQAESTNVFTVRVADDGNPSLSATQRITVMVFNHAPVIAAVTPQTAQQNRPFTLQLQASDAESDTLTWSLLDGPPGLLIDPVSGLLTWTPTSNLATVAYSVRVIATDNGRPAKSGETTFLIRLLSADTLAEIQFDPSAYAPNTIIESNSLGPDWFNTRGRIVRTTEWATNPYQVASWVGDAPVYEQNIPFFLQSQRVSRDQEVDCWVKYGMAYLRLTEDGTAIAFSFNLYGDGGLTISYTRGVSTALENYWADPVAVLYSTNNLAALIPGYRENPTDGDYFTVGVEGVDIYAKYNGRAFLRFKDYRHVKAGAVALRPNDGYGIRATAARFKADKPLFSDPAARLLDLRDFGLRSVQVAGSIEAGSTQLVLNASPEPPFKPGDWIIVETGAEAGRGQRGTLGVGGVWPKLHYANPAARDADTSQPNNTYCWIETDGSVRQWDGVAWQDRAHFLDGTNVVENFYVAKAMPKALRAVVTRVASNALTLTLDEPAQASVTNAPVHFDNAPVLNLLSLPLWAYIHTNLTLIIPPGNYAMGDPLWLGCAPGCGIRGAGTNLTRLFSPAGTPSASIGIYYSSNAFVESLHLQGNDVAEGCGLAWDNPRGMSWNGVTETQADGFAGRGSVALDGCDGGRVRDVLITDVPNCQWYGALNIGGSDVIIERVRIERRLPARGPGAMVGFAGCKRLAATSLEVLSDRLAQGLMAGNLQDVEFRQVQGRNVFFILTDIRGNVAIRDSRFEFDPLAQEGQSDYWAPTSTWWDSILSFEFNRGWTGQQILVENVVMEQRGYLNRRQESLRGIMCWSTTAGKSDSLRVIGGSYSSPDYLPGTGGNAGIGVSSDASSTWIEGFRVSGLAQLGGNGGGNIFASHGVITNSWADDIRPFPDAQIVNSWANTNLAPVIGRLIESPTTLLTQSSVLGATGNPIELGSTRLTNGLVELVAGGRSAGNLDAGRYVWTEMTGDYDVAVRVESLLPVNSDSHAGIMIRRNLEAGSPQANIQLLNNNWARTYFRTIQGQSTENNWGEWMTEQPYAWLRLRKEGSRITTFTGSTHGWIWRTNASFDLPNVVNSSSNSTLLGLYAASEDNTAGRTTRAVFRDLRLINLSPLPVQPVDESTSVRFTVPAVDFNNPLQQLSWSLLSASPIGATIDANTGDFIWIPTEAQGPSINIVTVRVSDNGTPSLSATQSFSVVVREVNTAPVLTVPVDQTINELTTLNVSASATDVDVPANTLTFGLVAGPSGLTVNPASGAITWTPTEAQGPSTNLVTVRVSDNGTSVLSATNSFTVVVREVNTTPVFTVLTNATVNELATLTMTNAANDTDVPANVLTYELLAGPVGMVLNPVTGVLTWTPTEAQGPSSNVVTVRVFDDGAPSLSAAQSFSVVVREVNTAPVLAVPVDQVLNELDTLTVTNTAADVDIPANTRTFALVAAPVGMVLDPNTGVLTWTPTEVQGPSTNLITVRVFDNGVPSMSAINSFTVVVREVNTRPVLTLSPDATISELVSYTANATATDADIPTNLLSFALVSGPAGLTVSPSGAIEWTPAENQGPSTNLVTITVADGGSPILSATQSFTLVVTEVNVAPVLPPQANRTINRLTTLIVTNTATDSDIPANTLAYTLLAAPSGATISSGGILAWIPNETQESSTNTFTTVVTDNGTPNLSATNSFTVIVLGAVAPPVIHLDPATVLSGGEFRFRFSGTSGQRYVIQKSDNLIGWIDLQTNTMGSSPLDFFEKWGTNTHQRFFRVFGLP